MKLAFEKIIKDKELLVSLINAFLTKVDDDNTSETNINPMEKYYKNKNILLRRVL